ncbi:hypothetical protein J6590_014976 [Homalodisca vitripennis]|nr:hypothetical protein J6590_014976 [Homalodisca vitripennis]
MFYSIVPCCCVAVVLWAFVESRHAGRPRRSLDPEGKGSNLTQTQQEEAIHSEVLQHFTTTPSAPSESTRDVTHDSAVPFIRDVPSIPEDNNVQSLKNEDHPSVAYDRRISIDKETSSKDSADKSNATSGTNRNDLISYEYNQTGLSSSQRSEIFPPNSTSEQVSTLIAYDEEDNIQGEKEDNNPHPIASSTESHKTESEWKNFESKKKEKGKKEILDLVTVPTDHNGAGRIEKPFKDNINVKSKEKSKDSIPEASDERRSTTSRISDSNSFSVSEYDNNRPLDSIDNINIDPVGVNKESVNQSVNSVINSNGVGGETIKKYREKPSVKRAHNESTDPNANDNQMIEETAKNTVPVLNSEPQTTPIAQTSTTSKFSDPEQLSYKHPHPTDSGPTKIDILGKLATASTTTIIKPSITFKQQLANKLKGLEPVPTAPMNVDVEADENQEKSNVKSSTKSSSRKKPKGDFYASPSDMYIPPTATAWTLVSLKTPADSIRSSQKPALVDAKNPVPETSSTAVPRLTSITPIARVKSFIPWSTRLRKNTSPSPPTTVSINGATSTEKRETVSSSEPSTSASNQQIKEKLNRTKEEITNHETVTEEQSVIHTTLELDRNLTEVSINLVQPIHNDIMVKDQSSTQQSPKVIQGTTTEKIAVPNPTPKDTIPPSTFTRSEAENRVAEKENIIETKQTSEEKETHVETEKASKELAAEEKPSITNNTVNEVSFAIANNENVNSFAHDLSTSTSKPDVVEPIKNNTNEISESDPVAGDILLDGIGDEGKSAEEGDDEDYYKLRLTTTQAPIFDSFETTVMPDFEDDSDVESYREDDEFAMIDKLTTNQTTTTTEHPGKTNLPIIEIKPTQPSFQEPLDANSTGTYVTSFDIVSKENTTIVVTKTPSEGDINWYNVDSKPDNSTVGEATQKTVAFEVTTTPEVEITNEPETTTEMVELETTMLPRITKKVTTASPITTIPVTEPTLFLEDDRKDINACVLLKVHMSMHDFCQKQQEFKESIAKQFITVYFWKRDKCCFKTSFHISWEQVVTAKLDECSELNYFEQEVKEENLDDVVVCFVDEAQLPSPALRDLFWRTNNSSIIVMPSDREGFDNVLVAIILSIIAAVCLVLLGILLIIIRKRQGRFNYGQRCTPVSLDDYSLDNISVYNSIRRKGALRASKRSYGNPAFDDPGGPTHSINFAGLANFSSDRKALDEEFGQIPMITVKPDELPPGVESKNRYANVIPLPETRVVLQTKEGADTTDEYINANYVKGPKSQEKLYIACQAPLQSTIEDFWRMVWQQQTKVILMLTALNENGVEKCADYLPQLEITDCHRLFGDFQVTLKKHEVREKYIISSLQLKNLETNLWREVTHLWYSSWPPQGVPDDGSAMIAFLIEARSYMRGAQGPTVVHCSPGTGRTGTVIAIDLCIRDFETIRTVDIPKTVYSLRRDRAGSVQTKDQYAFIYQVLNLYATKLTGGALDSI